MRKLLVLAAMAVAVMALGLLPEGTGKASPSGGEYADAAISISRVTSGTNSAGVAIDTTADDGDLGGDATGAPDWAGNQTWAKITVLGIDQKSTPDPTDDVGGVVVLAFTDNVCVDSSDAAAELYVYDAIGNQSVNGNESADIDVAIGSGAFVPAGSVSPGLGYALDVSGALPYFTRVRLTATDFAGQLTSAGLDLDAVECLNSVDIASISLSAANVGDTVNPIGTTHTVQATITPPIQGVVVTFTITGPNAQTGTGVTDAFGVASFTYTGSSAGTDSIVASVTFEETTIAASAVQKTWYDRFVSGGGQLVEESTPKRPGWHVISFGGFAASAGASGLIGEWQVNFHNVGVDAFDKTSFHTTSITDMNFYGPLDGCIAMNFTAIGVWNGTPGYTMIFRAQDAGEPGNLDNARIQLYAPGGDPVYDTHGEFTDIADYCYGQSRTYLDHGNLQMADLMP